MEKKDDLLKIYNSYLQIDLKGDCTPKNEAIRIRGLFEIKNMAL